MNVEAILLAYKWPIVIVIVCIIFRKALQRVLSSRDVGITRNSIKITGGQTQAEPAHVPHFQDNLRPYERVIVDKQVEQIENDPLYIETPVTNRLKLVLRDLARSNIVLHFERVNGLIWGSQVRILQDLNAVPEGVELESMRTFFDSAGIPTDVMETYPFEQYIGFLESSELILRDGTRLRITDLGRAFLTFLVETSRTAERPF